MGVQFRFFFGFISNLISEEEKSAFLGPFFWENIQNKLYFKFVINVKQKFKMFLNIKCNNARKVSFTPYHTILYLVFVLFKKNLKYIFHIDKKSLMKCFSKIYLFLYKQMNSSCNNNQFLPVRPSNCQKKRVYIHVSKKIWMFYRK